MEFGQKIFRQIDIFDFTSCFGLYFFKFSGPLCLGFTENQNTISDYFFFILQAKLFPPRHDTMLPKGSYENRTVLITGGGTGLGKGMALKFSELGANVAIAAR